MGDIAASKLCAWREKDRDWLETALVTGVLGMATLRTRVDAIGDADAPSPEERRRRLDALATVLRGPSTR